MVKRKSLFDRVVDQAGVLPNKCIPCGLIALDAASYEAFFLFGHRPVS